MLSFREAAMFMRRWVNSVATRLVGAFCLGGVALSIGLGALEYQRARSLTEVATTQQMLDASRNLKDMLRALLRSGQDQAIDNALAVFTQDPRLPGVRVEAPDGHHHIAGRWKPIDDRVAMWRVDGSAHAYGKLDLSHPTMLLTSLTVNGATYRIQMLVDGPFIAQRTCNAVIRQLSGIWLILGLLTLVGLMILRRWLITPMTQLLNLTGRNAPATEFDAAGEQMPGEFSRLADSIAGMLRRLDQTTHQLRQRERAFEHLYAFAPAAMISVGPDGRIVEANRRAAELLRLDDDSALVGAEILQFIVAEDRGLFRQCIDRVESDRLHQAELRLSVGGQVRDLRIEFAAVHNETGRLTHVRLSLLDITDTKQLARNVNEQRRLMDLVIGHMSDAVLLIDVDGRIITGNTRLSQLLHVNHDDLAGQKYDPGEFWSRLEMLNHNAFTGRMRHAIQRLERPIQEQFETADGAFLFQVIPVYDESHQVVAHLWVVQEVSAQVRARRLLEHQAAQLQALRQIGRKLQHIENVDDLLLRSVRELYRVFNVEAVGVALRSGSTGRRCSQMLCLDDQLSPLPAGNAIAQTIAGELMPRVMSNRATSFWTDLSQHGKWTAPLVDAGFETMAATSIFNGQQTQGVFWVARRGGQRIERHHLFLMEALTPLLSACAENACLHQRMLDWRVVNTVTSLPEARLLKRMIARRVCTPGVPWALTLIALDDYDAMVHTHGQATAHRILRHIADLLRDHCRAGDDIIHQCDGRFIILSDQQDIHEACPYADRLKSIICETNFAETDEQALHVHVSTGVAASPDDHHQSQSTLQIAEQRLAAAQSTSADDVHSIDHR